jgi:hypothetical protein
MSETREAGNKFLINTAIPDVSKRWQPNNNANNIQVHPSISITG